MRLLVVTQVVDKNHPVLGFFHRWLEEFARYCQQVVVVCLQAGQYDLPSNVKVLSLGKEKGGNKIIFLYKFLKYIWQERFGYDSVFVHMNPEYVILGGVLWKGWQKKIGLWYVHRSVTWKLRLAEKLADVIFTASKKSFRLPSSKVAVVGHGIDTDRFKPKEEIKKERVMLMVGRISPTKRQLVGVQMFAKILADVPQARLLIIGRPVLPEDNAYFTKIKQYLANNNLTDKVLLKGAIPHDQLPAYYNSASVVLNLSTTGSLDKDVLEALACNTAAVTTNEAFFSILPPEFIAISLSEAQEKAKGFLASQTSCGSRSIVVDNFSLPATINKICNYL